MSITISGNTAHIKSPLISYIIYIADGKYPVHGYFGKTLRSYHGAGFSVFYKRGYNTSHNSEFENVSFDDFPFEYPTRGNGDFRIPAFSVTQENGVDFTNPTFKSMRVLDEKPKADGLPSVCGENAETLEIICEDETAGLRVYMYYTVFDDTGVIVRSQRFENFGAQTLYINNAQSMSLELPHGKYDYMTLYGTHAKEANIERFPIHHGIQKTESARGASSPQYHPFFALTSPDTSEEKGEAYAFQLIYSGNFLAQTELDQFGNVRCQLGINPDTFRWELKSGDVFYTPEAVLNYSDKGLGGMSENFHALYRKHLMPKRFAYKERPVLLNSWESMYYDVSLEKIDSQSDIAKKLGIELFILDDGWFRKGNDSHSSMGDWICNENKLKGGIKAVSDLIHSKGMQFGLWFEPEAVSKDSRLYREHPDWILHIPDYEPTEGRHEYLLDLTRSEVRDYIVSVLTHYLGSCGIDYVKWDMNRPLTDVNSTALGKSQKGETAHRYVLGLYDIMGRITEKFPEVLFEGCSSGGARFDPGILYYFPQNWTSDNTDAFDRVQIQSGYSMLYPPIAMGAHVSITPNHQTGRTASLKTRQDVAGMFNFGYELDLTKMSDGELNEMAAYISKYKSNRHFLANAEFRRHDVPDDNYTVWSMTSADKKKCVIMIFQKLYNPLSTHVSFRISSLDEKLDYIEQASGKMYGGDELKYCGISIPVVKEDFHTFIYDFKAV